MSPQGRKRASAMVARDFRTVSGIGQSYHNNNQTIVVSDLNQSLLLKRIKQFKICLLFSFIFDKLNISHQNANRFFFHFGLFFLLQMCVCVSFRFFVLFCFFFLSNHLDIVYTSKWCHVNESTKSFSCAGRKFSHG